MSFALPVAARAPIVEFVVQKSTRRAAALLLLAVYVVLSLALDVRGTLGTDTGGKLATLAEMDRRSSLVPDVGYWAGQADPEAVAHPLYYTQRFDQGYVNVTTLPMLLAARPLDAMGGSRLVLLLPMLGGVLTAVAARRLAVRLGSVRPDVVFWVVGLASPTLIYSLDVWEHSLGLGLMALGADAAFGAVERVAMRWAALSGVAFGVAATMRTEALLYFAAVAVVFAVVMWRRAPRKTPAAVAALLAGAFAPLGINEILERALLGDALRSARASDTLVAGGARVGDRFEEGLRTLVGLNLADHDIVIGAVLAGLLVAAATGVTRSLPRVVNVALLGASLLLIVRMAAGVGFVSGMVSAFPITAFAVAAPTRRLRVVAIAAVSVLPAVWGLQYLGGAGPQWGGRYVLFPGLILAVVGMIALERAHVVIRRWVVGLTVCVTAFGFVSVAQRTHDVADTGEQIAALDDDVVVSTEAHLLREVGHEYSRQRRWLTAVGPQARALVANLLRDQRPRRFAVITRGDAIEVPIGYVEWSEPLEFLGVDFVVRHYARGPV